MRRILIAAGIAALAALFASRRPDGLERAAELLGFAHKSVAHPALLSGYGQHLLLAPWFSGILAGIAGVLAVYGLFQLCAFVFKKIKPPEN